MNLGISWIDFVVENDMLGLLMISQTFIRTEKSLKAAMWLNSLKLMTQTGKKAHDENIER